VTHRTRPILASLTLAALATTLAGQPAPPPPPAAPAVLAIVGATVIPMDRERTLADHTVVVRDGRIEAVGPRSMTAPPAGAVVIDGTGRFVVPGLAEMHGHIPGGNAPGSAITRMLLQNVAAGVTFVRGMLGHPRHLELRERANRGDIIAPWIVTSGPSLNGNSIPTPAAAAEAVAAQKAAGYDFLKLHPGVSLEAFTAMADAARTHAIRFAGHVPLDVGLARALDAGIETVDHIDGFVEAMVRPGAPVKTADSVFFGVNLMAHVDPSRLDAQVAHVKRAGAWIVPTQTLFEGLFGPQSTEALAARPEMTQVGEAQRRQWIEATAKYRAIPGAGAKERAEYLALRRRMIKALHEAGVGMLLGADAPQIWNVPGAATLREAEAMVAAGLTPYEALAMGTINVARFYRQASTFGTVAPGRRADLVVLSGNPLDDIRNLWKLEGVVLKGTWHSRAALQKALAAVEPPTP